MIFFYINQPEIRMVYVGRLLTDLIKISNLNRWPSIDASYQVSVHLAKQFLRRFLEIDQPETILVTAYGFSVSEEKIFFRNQPISNKNYLWWTYLLTDMDEMSNLYRRPSIYATY
jgi:hypothetical protein